MADPNAGGVGCQNPGSVAGVYGIGVSEPSLIRNRIIAAAAASPAATPLALLGPSGILASEFAKAASRLVALPGKYVQRTRCAAAMTAASSDAVGGAKIVPRYGL